MKHITRKNSVHTLCILAILLFSRMCCLAQDNYEIQVYGSPTVAKGSTMLELHSNFTNNGSQVTENGVLPTNHIFHETIEITHGFTDWFETGFYFFNAIGTDHRTNYVGSHIRPRVMAPEKWHWPVGVSLSAEVGYQRKEYSQDDYTLEIRPIIDKTWKKWYVALNPVLDKSLRGLNSKKGYDFSPNIKLSYNFSKIIGAGFEYYGSTGSVGSVTPYQQQQHQLFLVTDIEWSADWEFNAGYGLGFTNATDNDIFKVIIGYRFHKRDKPLKAAQPPTNG